MLRRKARIWPSSANAVDRDRLVGQSGQGDRCPQNLSASLSERAVNDDLRVPRWLPSRGRRRRGLWPPSATTLTHCGAGLWLARSRWQRTFVVAHRASTARRALGGRPATRCVGPGPHFRRCQLDMRRVSGLSRNIARAKSRTAIVVGASHRTSAPRRCRHWTARRTLRSQRSVQWLAAPTGEGA
jgi:hypothetical protein